MAEKQAPLFRVFFFLLVVPALVFARTSMKVPAVDATGEGVITTVEADAVQNSIPGVFIDTNPRVSVETQQSAELAARIAAKEAGVDLSEYSVLFRVTANVDSIDGPSGGAAFALLAYAEFTGKGAELRSDAAATGAIEEDGSIGGVGGIADKAAAAHDAGLELFLIPRGQGIQQGVDLIAQGDEWGMQIAEVSDFEELVSFAFTPEGTRVNATRKQVPPLVLLPANASPGTEAFKEIALGEIEKLKEVEKTISARSDNVSRNFLVQLREAINSSEMLAEKGYYYSAANAAFVAKTSADAFLLSVTKVSKKDFEKMLERLEPELNQSFEKRFSETYGKKTLANWEWIAGAAARFYWAKQRLQEVKERAGSLKDPAPLFEDYAGVTNWLDAAEQISAVAERFSDGTEANEFAVRELASNLIDSADGAVSELYDSEADWHLAVARNAFGEGDYLEAAFDACLSRSFAEARIRALENIDNGISGLLEDSSSLGSRRNSLWAELYFIHSLYNTAEANRSQEFVYSLNALKLQEFAKCLSENAGETATLLASEKAPEASETPSGSATASPGLNITAVVSNQSSPEAQRFLLLLEVLAIAFLVIALVLFIASRLRMRSPPLSDEERMERLDDLLLREKISERAYDSLKKKYGGGGSGEASEEPRTAGRRQGTRRGRGR